MCQSCANISAELATLTMESYAASTQPLNIMDPEGDVVFLLDGFGLHVSSKVLSLASPVFKAMFGPNFAEGQGLASSTEVRRIELKDDDAEAMSILCGVLHHTSNYATTVGIELLEQVAILVDKYDCAHPLRYWSSCELRALIKETVKEPYRLLWPAYAFNEAGFFNGVTKYLVVHVSSSAAGEFKPPKEITSLLPEGLIGHIKGTEQNIKRIMHFDIENLITPIVEKHTPTDYLPGSDDFFLSHCDCMSISMFINALARQGLWPMSAPFERYSIARLCQKLEACDFGLPNRVPKSKKCSKCPEDMAAKIARITKRALTSFDGLCLDCVRNPGRGFQDWSQCRVPHQNFRGFSAVVHPVFFGVRMH